MTLTSISRWCKYRQEATRDPALALNLDTRKKACLLRLNYWTRAVVQKSDWFYRGTLKWQLQTQCLQWQDRWQKRVMWAGWSSWWTRDCVLLLWLQLIVAQFLFSILLFFLKKREVRNLYFRVLCGQLMLYFKWHNPHLQDRCDFCS